MVNVSTASHKELNRVNSFYLKLASCHLKCHVAEPLNEKVPADFKRIVYFIKPPLKASKCLFEIISSLI